VTTTSSDTEVRQLENGMAYVRDQIKRTNHARRIASLKRQEAVIEQRLAELRAEDR
jgi:hypothetical protein